MSTSRRLVRSAKLCIASHNRIAKQRRCELCLSFPLRAVQGGTAANVSSPEIDAEITEMGDRKRAGRRARGRASETPIMQWRTRHCRVSLPPFLDARTRKYWSMNTFNRARRLVVFPATCEMQRDAILRNLIFHALSAVTRFRERRGNS